MRITTTLPEKCWLHSNKRYYCIGEDVPVLPSVKLEHEFILKDNDIPYRKRTIYPYVHSNRTEEICEYWNPETGLEERELTLPLFASVPGGYRYCDRNYAEKVPTEETVAATTEIKEIVAAKVKEHKEYNHKLSLCELAKTYLAGETSKMCFDRTGKLLEGYLYDIEVDGKHFRIIRYGTTDFVAIFNMKKIVPYSQITLQVPNNMVGRVIGKDGNNIKVWAKELKVRKIQVIPI